MVQKKKPVGLVFIGIKINKKIIIKKFKNSFGVIIDDIIAGFYVVLTLIIFMIIKVKFLS